MTPSSVGHQALSVSHARGTRRFPSVRHWHGQSRRRQRLWRGRSVEGAWSLPCAALAIGQGNGERDAQLLTDAPGDVPVAGQIFSYQDVAGGKPSLGTIGRLKFRQS